jgi:hypothetical protein
MARVCVGMLHIGDLTQKLPLRDADARQTPPYGRARCKHDGHRQQRAPAPLPPLGSIRGFHELLRAVG